MKRILLFSFVLLASMAEGNAQNVMLNEIMQSNIDYMMVEKDFPDSWVELYNPTASTLNIGGYRLGEKEDFEKAYALPAGTRIEAGGHLLIYCDKENRGLHTSFRVDAGKASLFLFNGNGEVIDQLEVDDMPAANVAYGRVTDGAEEWQYEVTPTAGEPNSGVVSDLLLPDPEFSMTGGVFSEGSQLMVTISVPKDVELPRDTRICVTTDGTEPTLQSRAYPGSYTMVVNKTTIVRAKLMSTQALSPRSTTHSYIFHPRETKLPVVSIVTNREYLYGNEIGILSGMVNNGKPNYMQSWRRPLNIEYFDLGEEGGEVFNQLCETAVSGVSTREQPQKSMKMYANKRFEKKTFKGHFWEDKPEVKKVKSFVLRSGGNNSFTTRINDAAIQSLFGTHVEELDWQAYRPVIVYINGTYAGEFGMRERSNEDFVDANHDVEDLEMADETSYQTPEKGSLFESFYRDYHNASITYEQLAAEMDMDNFIATLVVEMYSMNTDFPTNNVSLWRSTEEDGRWRWILKDLDRAGMNLALYPSSFDMFRFLFEPDDIMFAGMHHFDLYAKMASLPEFRERFIDVMSVQLGDFLKPGIMAALLDKMSEEIYSELQPTFYYYNCRTEWSQYNTNLGNLKEFFNKRPGYLYSQMAQHFGLGRVLPVKVTNADSLVSINGIRLTEGDFDGSYFADRALRLDAGSDTLNWSVTIMHADGTEQTVQFDAKEVEVKLSDYQQNENEKIQVCFNTYVVEVPEPDAIKDATVSTASSKAYDVRGMRQSDSYHGIRIQDGRKVIR